DEVIRENSQEWRELLDRAKPAMEYKFEAIRSRTDTNDPRARSQAVQELLPVIGAIADPVVRAHYLQRLSRLALLKEEDLAAMLPRARSGREQAAIQRSNIRRDNKEDFFLSLLLYFPELRKLAVQAPLNLLWHSENKQVFEAWQAASDFAELHASLSDELRQHVDRLLAQGEKFPPEWNADGGEAAFRDCWQRLEKRQRELEKQAATALLADQEQELPDKLVTLEAAVRMLEGQELEEGEEAKIKEVASIYIQDTRAGLELHGQRVGEEGREEETEAIYIENVEVSS
ncbi:MAG TPA: hypothetical protein VNL15_07890, partial [Dehalococcoidia bacterium]|nr:hypothetical protein [Dehalococcoidia bacterium]